MKNPLSPWERARVRGRIYNERNQKHLSLTLS